MALPILSAPAAAIAAHWATRDGTRHDCIERTKLN
jgi:hypothetical protein